MARFLIVWGNGAPIPGFPRPRPEFSGTGRGLTKISGDFWGWGWLKLWVFLGFYPQKSPKNNWGNFGDGDRF